MTFDEILDDLRTSDDSESVTLAAEAFELLAEESSASEVVERLLRLLGERHLKLRRAAVIALGRLGGPDAAPRLVSFLESRNGKLRRDALVALRRCGSSEHLGACLRLLRDRKAFVRKAAVRTVVCLGQADVFAELGDMLDEEKAPAIKTTVIAQMLAVARIPMPDRAGVDADRDESDPAVRGVASEDEPDRETLREVRREVLDVLLTRARRESDPELTRSFLTAAGAVAGGLELRDRILALKSTKPILRSTLANLIHNHRTLVGPALSGMVEMLRARTPDRDKLASFGTDLVGRAREGELARGAWQREDILDRMVERFNRKGPTSVLLVGPAGVGKTAIVHELARRLAAAPVLEDSVLLEATTGDLLTGTKFLGEWQTRLRAFLDEIRSPSSVIWFAPSADHLLEAGSTASSSENFAGMITPLLRRGELTIVGETTTEGFRLRFDRDPSFRKHFLVLHVEEPSRTETVEILRRVVAAASSHALQLCGRDIVVSDGVLIRLLELAESFVPSLVRPGNALSILDDLLDQVLDALQPVAASDSGLGRFGLSLPARSRGPALELGDSGPIVLDEEQVIMTVSRRTGVPELMLNDRRRIDFDKVRDTFGSQVLGQPRAVSVILDLIRLIKSDLTDPKKPLASLLFVGPTGVGKTLMAKELAKFLFGSEDRLVRLDMSDFSDAGSQRLLVHGPGGRGPGLLTAPVRERPFSVVLLDELEKATPKVFDLLLPLLDEGHLSDDNGEVTDFRRAIIIMTSNIASDLEEGLQAGFVPADQSQRDAMEEKVQRRMAESFRPEFQNRIDKVVLFEPLTIEVMRQIIERELESVKERPGLSRRQVRIVEDDSVYALLMQEGFSHRFGARPLKRRVESLVLRPLSRTLLELGEAGSEEIVIELRATGSRIVAEATVADPIEGEPAPSGVFDRVGGLTVRDPAQTTRRVSIQDLRERLEAFQDRVDALADYSEKRRFAHQKAKLSEEMSNGEFWDGGDQVKRVSVEFQRLKRLAHAPESLGRSLQDHQERLEAAESMRSPRGILERAARESARIDREIKVAEIGARCLTILDHQDAWVSIRRLGKAAHERDLTRAVATMYLEWARREGLEATVILENSQDGRLDATTLLVQGELAFGLLRGETGLHQFTTRLEQNRRLLDFVRVSVIPDPVETRVTKADAFWEEVRRLRSRSGVLVPKLRTHVVLTDRETRITVAGESARKPDEALAELRPFLAARLAAGRANRRAAVKVSSVDEARARIGVIRKYHFGSSPYVRDEQSEIKSFNVEGVLKGDLDDFIIGRLDRSARVAGRSEGSTPRG